MTEAKAAILSFLAILVCVSVGFGLYAFSGISVKKVFDFTTCLVGIGPGFTILIFMVGIPVLIVVHKAIKRFGGVVR